jgi:hypothetical protein
VGEILDGKGGEGGGPMREWMRGRMTLKVHKHEIILNFFLTKIKSLYSLGKFSKKISLLFLRFSPEFRSSNIFAVTEHTRNQIFLERYPKRFYRTLSILGNHFIAH